MARKGGWDSPPTTVTVEVDGKEYSGTYTVSSGIVTAQSIYGSSTTQAGGSGAQIMARTLLREIVRTARARGEGA